jgi:predicted aspartyl protease
MVFFFDPSTDLVKVRAVLMGPKAKVALRLALDTGATQTVLARLPLLTAGYELSSSADTISVATGSRIEQIARLKIDTLISLGQVRDQFPVLVHDLPFSPKIDGVLGLDFLRGHRLTLDFRVGELELV